MALDFPLSPTNGQEFNNYYYDSGISAWRSSGSKTGVNQRTTALEVADATTNKSGLVPVVPTSVSGTGVTLSTGGRVSFTAASVININGCFTATYDNYLVVIDAPTSSAANTITMQLRLSGSTLSTALYDGQWFYVYGATLVASQSQASTSWNIIGSGGITGTLHSGEVRVFGPALVQATTAIADSMSATNPMSSAPTGGSVEKRSFLHRTVASYDGFAIAASTGTINGAIRIYGYNNNI